MIQAVTKPIEHKACLIYISYENIEQKPNQAMIEKLHNFRDKQLKGKMDKQWLINKYYETSAAIFEKNIPNTIMLKIASKVIKDYLPQIIDHIEKDEIEQSIRLTDKMLDDCIATANANNN